MNASIDVNAQVKLCDETYTHATIESGTIETISEFGATITATREDSVNYNLPLKEVLQESSYYLINIGMNSSERTYVDQQDEYSRCDYRYFIIYAGQKYYFNSNNSVLSILVQGNDYSQIALGCEFDLLARSYHATSLGWFAGSVSGEATMTTRTRVWQMRPDEVANNSALSSVTGYLESGNALVLEGNYLLEDGILLLEENNTLQEVQIELQEQENVLQQEGNELQQESNEIQQELLEEVEEFHDSFFDKLIDAIKRLFIPEDGYFADFFTRLNDFFAEKLGVLYAPIDIFIDILTGIMNADGSNAGIPFPGIAWEGIWIIEPQMISLGTYSEMFPDLQEKIYFVSDVIMVGSVLWLLQQKLKEVMTN